ncbi:hypothetical protein OHA71_23665 [Streptomyces sp. NBC_00444]|uniref:hypothetical protein n=1 Tax=Streptomyces sp. NBC_00444 TaxID=2975744 RepID=UPI002E208390
MNDHTQPPTTPARRGAPVQTREARARTHIKAVLEVIKEQQPGQLAQPAGLFMSGMLAGLSSSVDILGGSTAEGALEKVNTRLAAAVGEAYLAGALPAQPAAADTDRQLTREEEIRGVQGWMAMDLHQALGLDVDEQATHQGHGSWADWWADLCGRARQRTYAELAYAQALAEPEDITANQQIRPRLLTRGLPPAPEDLFFPVEYGAAIAEPHATTPQDPPCVIDLSGYVAGDPLREVTRQLIVHRSLVISLVRDLAKLTDPQTQPDPAEQLAKVDAILRDNGIEHPLGARGVSDLATMAKGRLEDLRRTEAERDGAYRERAHLVALLAAYTDGAVVAPAPDVDEPGWQIAYLYPGGRQASWHFSPRDADLLEPLEHVPADDPRAQWDGHTTDAKYAHIAALTDELMRSCGPACAEGHTYAGRCESASKSTED